MKIRQKITVWIAGTALLAAVGFSWFIFYELLVEPYKLIDSELQNMADSMIRQLEEGKDRTPAPFSASMLPYPQNGIVGSLPFK